jgi:hypothetical protein
MSNALQMAVILMGVGRALIGLAPFVAAGLTSRALGFPAEHDTATARLMARMFGVRDIGLGVLAWYAVAHVETAPFLFAFNAAMDAGDLLSISLPLVRRQGIDRAALRSAVFAVIGGSAWLTVLMLLPRR